jgi:electron transfer flavoprotein alpha subunit
LATSAAPTLSGVVTLAVGASLQGASSTRVEVHGLRLAATHTIEFEGATDNEFETVLTVTDPTADRTITLPNATGTVALTSDLSSYATLASPTLTGTPAAPTAAASTSTTQVATTAFVINSSQDDQFVLAAAIFTS